MRLVAAGGHRRGEVRLPGDRGVHLAGLEGGGGLGRLVGVDQVLLDLGPVFIGEA